MKRNDLFDYVFDGLESSDRAEISAEFATEVAGLQNLKHDLQSLREVPECQLSVERVRDAILRGEMKRRTSNRRALWSLVPAAAVALGALFISTRTQNLDSSSSTSASRSEGTSNLVAAAIGIGSGAREAATMLDTVAPTASLLESAVQSIANSGSQVSVSKSVRRKVDRGSRPHGSSIQLTNLQPHVENAPPPNGGPSSAPAPTTVASTADAPNPQPQAPVIVITNEPAEGTGASRAHEMESSGNVVIGG